MADVFSGSPSHGDAILNKSDADVRVRPHTPPRRLIPSRCSCRLCQWGYGMLTSCGKAPWISPVRFTAAAKSTLPITAMRVGQAHGVSAYLTSAVSLRRKSRGWVGSPQRGGAGREFRRTVFNTQLRLTVTSGVPDASSGKSAGVVARSPTPGATTGSPVHLAAAAKSSVAPITTMRI